MELRFTHKGRIYVLQVDKRRIFRKYVVSVRKEDRDEVYGILSSVELNYLMGKERKLRDQKWIKLSQGSFHSYSMSPKEYRLLEISVLELPLLLAKPQTNYNNSSISVPTSQVRRTVMDYKNLIESVKTKVDQVIHSCEGVNMTIWTLSYIERTGLERGLRVTKQTPHSGRHKGGEKFYNDLKTIKEYGLDLNLSAEMVNRDETVVFKSNDKISVEDSLKTLGKRTADYRRIKELLKTFPVEIAGLLQKSPKLAEKLETLKPEDMRELAGAFSVFET